MKIVENIGLSPLAGQADAQPQSRILVDGRDTGAVADGVILEAAVAMPGRWLLFVTDDVPYEEGLRIQLFDAEWARIDRADMSWMYATGVFRDLRIEGEARLRFAFFDDAVRLKMLDAPKWFLWDRREPVGGRRPIGLRHFRLSRAS